MKKLVTSSEAAQILGLSLQGIHYRIKKGQLESIKQDGKIFVYIDSNQKRAVNKVVSVHSENNNDIVKVKDQQIEFLKKTIKYIKKQKEIEVLRLENQQSKMMNVFQSEVDLLKSAFNEMRTIYKVEHKNNIEEKSIVIPTIEFMDIKDFFVFMKKHNKTDSQIKSIILEKVKSEDKRFIYKKATKEVIIFKSDFLDII